MRSLRLLCNIAAAALMFTMLTFSAGAATEPPAGFEDDVHVRITNWFSDLDPNSRIGKAANFLANGGIIGGFPDGTFRKDRLVNRAEMAKFITNADPTCAVDDNNLYSRYSDVKLGEWYVKYVNAASDCGIIEGNPDGTFAPGKPVNTVEMLAMLSRAGGFDLPTNQRHNYNDVHSGVWYDKYAGVAQQKGFFPERRSDQLQPARSLTRGEVAYVLYLILAPRDDDHIDPVPPPPPPQEFNISAVIKVQRWEVNLDDGEQLSYVVKVYNHDRDTVDNVTLFHPDSSECDISHNAYECKPATIRGSGEYSYFVKKDLNKDQHCNTSVELSHKVYVEGVAVAETTNTPEIKVVCDEEYPLPPPPQERVLTLSSSLNSTTVKPGDTIKLSHTVRWQRPHQKMSAKRQPDRHDGKFTLKAQFSPGLKFASSNSDCKQTGSHLVCKGVQLNIPTLVNIRVPDDYKCTSNLFYNVTVFDSKIYKKGNGHSRSASFAINCDGTSPPPPPPPPPPQKDLTAHLSAPVAVILGKEDLVYQVTVKNHTDKKIGNITLMNPRHDHCNKDDHRILCEPFAIEANSSKTITVSHKTKYSPLSCGGKLDMSRAIYVDGTYYDASNTVHVRYLCDSVKGRNVTLSATLAATAKKSKKIVHTVVVRNNGSKTMHNISVENVFSWFDKLRDEGGLLDCYFDAPQGCEPFTLHPGQFKMLLVRIPFAQSVKCHETVTYRAKIQHKKKTFYSDTIHSKVYCDASQSNTADLSVKTKESELAVKPGEKLVYVYRAQNHGPDTATNVFYSFNFSHPQLKYVSSSGADCRADTDGISIKCNLGRMTRRDARRIKHVFRVPQNMQCGTQILGTSTVQSYEVEDPNIGDNRTESSFTKVECPQPESKARLTISQHYTGSSHSVPANAENLLLLRFEASAGDFEDILFTKAVFEAGLGSLDNIKNYAMWVDTDGDRVTDTILEDGVHPQAGSLLFADFAGGGYVVPAKKSVFFEVRGDVADNLTADRRIQLKFLTELSSYVEAEELDNGAALKGIQTGNTCSLTLCQIAVFPMESSIWNFTGHSGISGPSKIKSIINANPDPNGLSVPEPGGYPIGQFRFMGADFDNGSLLEFNGMIFTVVANNVSLDASGFILYNKSEAGQSIACQPFDEGGNALSGEVTGTLLVKCSWSGNPFFKPIVRSGENLDLALYAAIVDNKLEEQFTSLLQVSLQHFTEKSQTSFGIGNSHIHYFDKTGTSAKEFFWLDYPQSTVKSTAYQS